MFFYKRKKLNLFENIRYNKEKLTPKEREYVSNYNRCLLRFIGGLVR